MGFQKYTWKNRQSEHPGGRIITNRSTGDSTIVDVVRGDAEGSVIEDGDAFDAANMNGLETRIESAISAAESATSAAQSRADSAYSLANTASTTANTGVTNAASAKSRADSAYSLAETANSNANSKAPISHAVSAITYGVGNNINYGHLRLSDSTSETNNVSSGFAATPLAVTNAMNAAIGATTAASNKAPISHAVATTTYGAGNGTNYGHVRLSDLYYNGSAYNVNSGYAATPYAVYKAWEATGSVPPIGYSSTADIEGALSSLSVDESIKAIQGIKIEAPLSDSEKADALNHFDAKHYTTTTDLSCVLALALKGCIKRLDSQQEEINKLKSEIR